VINRALKIYGLLYRLYIPKYRILLNRGSTVPLDVLMGLQEKLFLGQILKQQDFLTLITISSGLVHVHKFSIIYLAYIFVVGAA